MWSRGWNLGPHSLWMWNFGFTQTDVSGLHLGARVHREYKSGGHLELYQSIRAPINRYGAQRARQLRPRCIWTVRSRTQSQINQSINQRVSRSDLARETCWLRCWCFAKFCRYPATGMIVPCFIYRSLMAIFLRLGNLHSRSCKGKVASLRSMRAYGGVKR
jgi:hypothetical protein